jgi:hypothetical protein
MSGWIQSIMQQNTIVCHQLSLSNEKQAIVLIDIH